MNAFQSAPNQFALALSKGRIFEKALPLLKAAGIEVTEDPETSRKLTLSTSDPALCVTIVHVSDVPAYVQYGATDLGVTGRSVLTGHGMTGLYVPIDLNTACCRMSVAVPKGPDYANAVRQGARLSTTIKYLNITREHFTKKGVHVDLIKLYGPMELGLLVGLADVIVNLVSTGDTLRANNLVGVEEIVQISSRLVVSRTALKLKRDRLASVLDASGHASMMDARVGGVA